MSILTLKIAETHFFLLEKIRAYGDFNLSDAPTSDPLHSLVNSAECVLCRDSVRAGPLGMVAVVAPSNVARVARRQCARRDWRRMYPEYSGASGNQARSGAELMAKLPRELRTGVKIANVTSEFYVHCYLKMILY